MKLMFPQPFSSKVESPGHIGGDAPNGTFDIINSKKETLSRCTDHFSSARRIDLTSGSTKNRELSLAIRRDLLSNHAFLHISSYIVE